MEIDSGTTCAKDKGKGVVTHAYIVTNDSAVGDECQPARGYVVCLDQQLARWVSRGYREVYQAGMGVKRVMT